MFNRIVVDIGRGKKLGVTSASSFANKRVFLQGMSYLSLVDGLIYYHMDCKWH